MANLGEEVILLRATSNQLGLIYLQSGNQYEVPLSILEDQTGNTGTSILKHINPRFVYQLVKLSD